jgi:hypothetical protein
MNFLWPLRKFFHPASFLSQSIFSLILSFLLSITTLISNFRKIAGAEILIFYWEGGFGHTLIGPDMVRRMFPDQRIVVLFAYWSPVRHNKFTAELWSDLSFIFLPVVFQNPITKKGLLFFNTWPKLLFISLRRLAKIAWPKKNIIIIPQTQPGQGFEQIDLLPPLPTDNPGRAEGYWEPKYHVLFMQKKMPPLRLPSFRREEIVSKLKQASGEAAETHRLKCCLYLRDKGELGKGIDPSSNYTRSGSELTEYLGSVRFLIEHGYQVLLTGDRSIPDDVYERFHGAFVDSHRIDVDQRLYTIYAQTECDVAICENGGGIWFPVLNGIPTLAMNMYPFNMSKPGVIHYFKALENDSGVLVKSQSLFEDFAFCHIIPGYRLKNISAPEITVAVSDFVRCLDAMDSYGLPISAVCDCPGDVFIRVVDGRVSPVWAAIYGEGSHKSEIPEKLKQFRADLDN